MSKATERVLYAFLHRSERPQVGCNEYIAAMRPLLWAEMFTPREKRFLESNELCRIATISEDNSPHLVPVCYIFKDGFFYIVSDLETKKVKNLMRDKRIALLVDQYKPNKAVLVSGEAEVITMGDEFRSISQEFFKKFLWARRDKWGEGEVAIIKVNPLRRISWGLGKG